MRIFLTLEFLALLSLTIGWWRDVSYRHSYSSYDDGWTISYKYSIKIRKQAYHSSYLAGVLAIVGVLFLIWTF